MSRDHLFDYWREALECALDGADVDTDLFTSTQLDNAAQSLLTSRECESMAFGYDCIPNPMNAEVAELKAQIKQLKNEHDERERGWSKAVADKLRLHSGTQVSLNRDGYLEAYNGRTTEL